MSRGLALRDVSIAIAGRSLVRHLDLDVLPGQVVTVMGPSGSGKSTLLDFIGGHLGPAFRAWGQVALHGRDLTGVAPEHRRIGVLFQDDLLFPHLSVGQNLAFGLDAAVRGRAARRSVIEERLSEAGLQGFADRDPATLSGGQRARVSLLRTLLSSPKALLLDEPFGSLDASLRAEFRSTVFAETAARGLPVLLVSHDAADAEAAGGPVIALAG